MAISNISYNYTGRKKDISILQSATPLNRDRQIVSPKFGDTVRFCAGVQKLIQKYTIILLTNLNSQPNFPDFGTSLIFNLRAGLTPIDKIAVTQLFSIASYQAVNTLLIYQSENPNIPEDEQIATAYLKNLVLSNDSVSFDVLITTATGEAVPFLIPLPE